MLHHGSVGVSSEKNKIILTLSLTLNLNLLLPSIAFHNKICVFIMIFTAYARLIFYMRRQCQLDYMTILLMEVIKSMEYDLFIKINDFTDHLKIR